MGKKKKKKTKRNFKFRFFFLSSNHTVKQNHNVALQKV